MKNLMLQESGLRPRGTVERECTTCQCRTWFDPLAAEATAIPFVCEDCVTDPMIGFCCTACNRHDQKPHSALVAEQTEHAHHCHACLEAKIPYRTFAPVVYCWGHAKGGGPNDKCPEVATQIKRWPKHCDCGSCWQTFYHVCDAHAAEWIQDLPDSEQKLILAERGAIITEYPDKSWSLSWPQPATS